MQNELKILDILRVLNEHQVNFIIVGGVCAVFHGAPVTTFDLDLVHSRTDDNLRRLLNALNNLEAYYRGHPKKLKPDSKYLASSGHHLLITKFGPLDLLGTIEKGMGYSELLKDSEEIQIENMIFRILKFDYLIKNKEESSRDKDRLILNILKQTFNEKKKFNILNKLSDKE